MQNNNVFFDALGVNIKIDEDYYSSEVLTLLHELCLFTHTRPEKEIRVHRNYYLCIILETEFYKIFVNYNGTNKGMGVFIETKGYKGCKILCEFLATHNYRWSLTRADIALDLLSTDHFNAFDSLQQELLYYAHVNRIQQIQTVGDWIYEKAGRTLYVGSKKSSSQVRLYEKSKEQHEKGNIDFPDNVIRIEVQFRPTSLQKKHLNILQPLEVLRISPKLLDLYSKFIDISIEPIVVGRAPVKTSQDSLDYAIDLYKNKIIDFISEVGYKSAIRYFIKKIHYIYLNKSKK